MFYQCSLSGLIIGTLKVASPMTMEYGRQTRPMTSILNISKHCEHWDKLSVSDSSFASNKQKNSSVL